MQVPYLVAKGKNRGGGTTQKYENWAHGKDTKKFKNLNIKKKEFKHKNISN